MAETTSPNPKIAVTVLFTIGFITTAASLFIQPSNDPVAVHSVVSNLWVTLLIGGVGLGIWRISSLMLLIPIVLVLWPHPGEPTIVDYWSVLSANTSLRAIVSLFLALDGGLATGFAVRLRDRSRGRETEDGNS